MSALRFLLGMLLLTLALGVEESLRVDWEGGRFVPDVAVAGAFVLALAGRPRALYPSLAWILFLDATLSDTGTWVQILALASIVVTSALLRDHLFIGHFLTQLTLCTGGVLLLIVLYGGLDWVSVRTPLARPNYSGWSLVTAALLALALARVSLVRRSLPSCLEPQLT